MPKKGSNLSAKTVAPRKIAPTKKRGLKLLIIGIGALVKQLNAKIDSLKA